MRHDFEISDTRLIKAVCLIKQAHGCYGMFLTFTESTHMHKLRTQVYHDYDVKPTRSILKMQTTYGVNGDM